MPKIIALFLKKRLFASFTHTPLLYAAKQGIDIDINIAVIKSFILNFFIFNSSSINKQIIQNSHSHCNSTKDEVY